MIATSLEQRARPPSPPGMGEAGVPVLDGAAPVDARSLAEARHRRWCNVRRVLLVRLDGVAGVLASTAAFAALHETMPWTQRTLLAAPEALVLRPHLQAVDELLTFNAPWTADGAAALNAEPSTMRGDAEMHLVRKLRRSHFDAAVLFAASSQAALPAALLCRMAGIPLTLAQVREPAHGLLSVPGTDDEIVVFSWITYPSRAARDEINAKVMDDPRFKDNPQVQPFDGKRMIYGGFESFLEL